MCSHDGGRGCQEQVGVTGQCIQGTCWLLGSSCSCGPSLRAVPGPPVFLGVAAAVEGHRQRPLLPMHPLSTCTGPGQVLSIMASVPVCAAGQRRGVPQPPWSALLWDYRGTSWREKGARSPTGRFQAESREKGMGKLDTAGPVPVAGQRPFLRKPRLEQQTDSGTVAVMHGAWTVGGCGGGLCGRR